MQISPPRMPSAALPQFYSDLTHACVILAIVGAATLAGDMHVVSGATVGNVYLGAVGYAAGRAGPLLRATTSHTGTTTSEHGDEAGGP